MLTKSLHTITAATNVARYVMQVRGKDWRPDGATLAGCALSVLGYTLSRAELTTITDPTIVRIVNACDKLLKE